MYVCFVPSVVYLSVFFVAPYLTGSRDPCRNLSTADLLLFLDERVCVCWCFVSAYRWRFKKQQVDVWYQLRLNITTFLSFLLLLPPTPLSLCSFSLPSSFAAALLLTSSLFLLHHSLLSCRLGLAPAAVVLLSPLECTPNRAWIWKATPPTHTHTPHYLVLAFLLHVNACSYFLPPPSRSALPVLVWSFFLSSRSPPSLFSSSLFSPSDSECQSNLE